MSLMMKIYGLAVLCLWLPAGLAVAPLPRDPGTHFFQETFGNLQEDLQIAREEGRQGLLLFFEMDECPWCQRMRNTVLNQPVVQDYYRKHFRILSIDVEGDLELQDFSGETVPEKDLAFERFGVRATPVFAFFDLDGRLLVRHTGPTASVEEFLWLGEYVTSQAYRDKSFAIYKRERRTPGENR